MKTKCQDRGSRGLERAWLFVLLKREVMCFTKSDFNLNH